MTDRGTYYIGTSGFTYDDWVGMFYPGDLPRNKWLEHYASRFDTVEINSSFYHLPRISTCEKWRLRTPENFTFAMKASRFITHVKKIRNIDDPLKKFFNVIAPLSGKCGPILFQLPPGMKKDLPLLMDFARKLPAGYRHVLEFRNVSWYEDDVLAFLDSADIAFCTHDYPGLATPVTVTGGFAYVRFHGVTELYSSLYSDSELEPWAVYLAGRVEAGQDVYAYFNNDSWGNAIRNAETMVRMLKAYS